MCAFAAFLLIIAKTVGVFIKMDVNCHKLGAFFKYSVYQKDFFHIYKSITAFVVLRF